MDSFESAFASGFLFGEILARCNVQPDFAKFVNKNTPDARINNFTRLQVRRFSGDFLEATRSTPPDSFAVRGRADTPRASTDGTRARPDLGPRETSFGSVNSFRRTRSPRFVFVSPPRRSPRRRRALSLPRRVVHLHASLHARTFCRLTPDTAPPLHHSAVPAKAGHPPGRARGDLRGARGARRGESPARAVEERARRDGARRRAEQKARRLGARAERVFTVEADAFHHRVPPRRRRVQFKTPNASRRGCQNLRRRRARARDEQQRFNGDGAPSCFHPRRREAKTRSGRGCVVASFRSVERTD